MTDYELDGPRSIQRHRAVLWVLSRYVTYRTHHHRNLTQHDLMDFLRRSEWKLFQPPNRHNGVANFLTVLDSPYEETCMCKHTWMNIGIVSKWARQRVRSPTSWLRIQRDFPCRDWHILNRDHISILKYLTLIRRTVWIYKYVTGPWSEQRSFESLQLPGTHGSATNNHYYITSCACWLTIYCKISGTQLPFQ